MGLEIRAHWTETGADADTSLEWVAARAETGSAAATFGGRATARATGTATGGGLRAIRATGAAGSAAASERCTTAFFLISPTGLTARSIGGGARAHCTETGADTATEASLVAASVAEGPTGDRTGGMAPAELR